MKVLEILSIDLDYFNYIQDSVTQDVTSFFEKLIRECDLPKSVAWMAEHQYLYPWCLRLMRSRRAKSVNVINIDEHHDFYGCGGVENFATAVVSCADFFAFMAHDGILNKYTWVNNERVHSDKLGKQEILNEIDVSYCSSVRKMCSRISVQSRSRIWRLLRGKKFDAIALFDSRLYTRQLKQITCAATSVLHREGIQIKRHKCRSDFKYGRRRKVDMRPIFRAAVV